MDSGNCRREILLSGLISHTHIIRRCTIQSLLKATQLRGWTLYYGLLLKPELETYNDSVKEVFEDIRYSVSRALKKFVNDLPDPDLSEEDKG